MTKFKVGDKIVGNAKANRYRITTEGWKGTVTKVGSEGYFAATGAGGLWGELDARCFDKVSKVGRPKKEKTVKFVAFYEKHRIDPYVEFEDAKALKKWLKEAFEDESIDNDSIKVWEVSKRVNFSFNTQVRLSKK